MKRFLSLFLTLILLLSFTGCGGDIVADDVSYVRLGSSALEENNLSWQIDMLASDDVTEYVCTGDYALKKDGNVSDSFIVLPGESVIFVNTQEHDRAFVQVVAKSEGEIVGYSLIKFETDLALAGKKSCMTAEVVGTKDLSEGSDGITQEEVAELIANDIKAENEKDMRLVSFYRWKATLAENFNCVRFLEFKDATEYTWQIVRLQDGEINAVTEERKQQPLSKVSCWNTALAEEEVYITVTANNGKDIIAYTVIKMIKDPYPVPAVFKTVVFSREELQAGVSKENVKEAIRSHLTNKNEVLL